MGSRAWLRATTAALVAVAPMIMFTTEARAAVGITAVADFENDTVPGQMAEGELIIGNPSSTQDEAVGAVTITDVFVIPSCGASTSGCPAPNQDTGVFDVSDSTSVTPSAGATCPSAFTVSVNDPASGELRFTPVGGLPMLDVGETCLIRFTTTTLRVPTRDSRPETGIQTTQIGRIIGTAANGEVGEGSGTSSVTVNRAPATVATTASPQAGDADEDFTDSATVTGAANGPTPTGTVTFQVFGPTSPGFPNCTGPVAFTSGPIDLTASSPLPLPPAPPTATASSGAFTPDDPTTPEVEGVGNYVFVATYSGDSNYLGVVSACDDTAEQFTVNPPPTITIVKTVDPDELPEPGGTFRFTVVVTNTSPETVTITSLTDTVYGNLGSANNSEVANSTCPAAIDTVLDADPPGAAPGGSFTCAFDGEFTGNADDTEQDFVTAVAEDSDGNEAEATDDATVRLTDVLPTVVVVKDVTPGNLPEPGGTFRFSVVVTNTSPEPVTITSLVDDVFGNLGLPGRAGSTCGTAVGTVLPVGGSFSCAFDGDFSGNAGDTEQDTVTVIVEDDDDNTATDDDVADVVLTDVLPTVLIDKTVSPGTLPEPGGTFRFSVVVTNTTTEAVTITSLTDDVYGDLSSASNTGVANNTCVGAVGTVLAPDPPGPGLGGVFSCAFDGEFTGGAGDTETDTATVVVADDDGNTATDSNDAVVLLTDVLPVIDVLKTVVPGSLPEPGGTFRFSVVVTNSGPEDVLITSLVDDVYGDLDSAANPDVDNNTCEGAVGTPLATDPDGAGPEPAGSFSCAFDGVFTGNAGDTERDTVTAEAVDDDGNTATADDDADVFLTDVLPSVTIDKTVLPGTLPEPGGTFRFSVVVRNTSVEPVTITSLVDDVYGNLASASNSEVTNSTCTTAIGTVLAADPPGAGLGGSYSCAFDGEFTGGAGDTERDTVTVIVEDDEDNTATDDDVADVTLTDVVPTVEVTKTGAPQSLPEPGGVFRFTVVVRNTSPEPVTITTLTDSIYGNLASATNPAVMNSTCPAAIGTVLAADPPGPAVGGTFSCAFDGEFTGGAGDTERDVVTVVVEDDDDNTATDTDDETVTITDVVPTVTLMKTARPETRPAPGGDFTFDVVVVNTSTVSVTITTLNDDIYGNIATKGTCTTAVGTVLLPGQSYSCSFVGSFTGASGSQRDVVTVVVTDDDGTTATDDDDATVTITPVTPPVLQQNTDTVAVDRPPATRAATLPRTGAGVTDLATLAVALVATGGLLLLGASRWTPTASSRREAA